MKNENGPLDTTPGASMADNPIPEAAMVEGDIETVLTEALYFAVCTLAFHRRDRGTDHQDKMLDDIEALARDLEPQIRAARHRLAASPAPATGGEGAWRSVEQPTDLTDLKGLRRSPKYYPAIGETCRMSGPNCDDAKGYTWDDVEVLWRDDVFIVTRKPNCWPTVTKLELALFEPTDTAALAAPATGIAFKAAPSPWTIADGDIAEAEQWHIWGTVRPGT